MSLARQSVEQLLQTGVTRRYTQDSPILPDVFIAYSTTSPDQVDLLLTPYRGVPPGDLAREIAKRLKNDTARKTSHDRPRSNGELPVGLTFNDSVVVARLYFDQLFRVLLPLTLWWQKYLFTREGKIDWNLDHSTERGELVEEMTRWREGRFHGKDMHWFAQLAGAVELDQRGRSVAIGAAGWEEACVNAIAPLVIDSGPKHRTDRPLLWNVSLNRRASNAIWRSVTAVKADAATRLFNISCATLSWGVIDGGIDATHPGLRVRDLANKQPDGKAKSAFEIVDDEPQNHSRVVATYDFTILRGLCDLMETSKARPQLSDEALGALKTLRDRLATGRYVDWPLLEQILRVPHTPKEYRPPAKPHGTHVAGIIAADWRRSDKIAADDDLVGLCPEIRLFDLRVLGDDGNGDEFAMLAALQFVRWLNANREVPVIHGLNISISMPHDVANYACGRTPVCDECQRLVNSGAVVVAAAGNQGYVRFLTAQGEFDGYRNISITDPGNAEGVLTVGSTHRFKPHTFGVSYFSSRGPTGDGRAKPDLVAPGEKIKSLVLGERADSMDGTSMAAPHVSGAAALLMARYSELIGDPGRIKQILCDAATDLGREKAFQGCGMLDVLRALQSV